MGLVILFFAYQHRILGMGIIGGVVLILGFFNTCLLLGTCEVGSETNSAGKVSASKKKPIKQL